MRLNSVAYELASDKLALDAAEKYAQSAIASTVLQMRGTSVDHLNREDVYQASRIAAYWDTYGWVRFQENDLAQAENYFKCAWTVRAIPIIGDHLGQLYEKQKRDADALAMYQMALAADPQATETRDRLVALAGPDAKIDALIEEGHRLLKESRTVAVSNSHQAEGVADFWILLTPGPKVEAVKFISGDDELSPYAKDLRSASFPNSFPEATELKLLRRGTLVCLRNSQDCRLQMLSSTTVPTDEVAVAAPSVAGGLERVLVGGNTAASKLLKKVNPTYPQLAQQRGVQGVVKLHAIIGKDGHIAKLDVMSGPYELKEAALDAVRQWVYQPTYVEGNPVEVDTTIDVIFQFSRN